MSWSIEEHIGDCRPFPAQVIVYKGETDERMAYVSGEVADRLKAENAKLRDELAKWERLTDGIDLPEYPVTQFKPKDLERENAKLRELVRDMLRWMPCPRPCSRCERYRYPTGCEFERRRRELGIEVG